MARYQCVKIPGWPTCLDCLAWSADSEIALACNETVEILIPRLHLDYISIDDFESEETRWLRVPVRVNLFSNAELSFIDPLPFDVFSIGEEQSASSIVAVAWSHPGLAKYDRCALAVLTSNLVLSIWACDSDFTVANNWKRVLVVNQGLKRHLEQASSKNDKTRFRSRVRAFTWSPSTTQAPNAGSELCAVNSLMNKDTHIIALANDLNEIIVCEIISPFTDRLHRGTTWMTAPLAFVGNESSRSGQGSMKAHLESNSSLQKAIDQISWSPWTFTDRQSQVSLKSYLAFTIDMKTCIKECSFRLPESQLEVASETKTIHLNGRCASPLKWVQDSQNGFSLLLNTHPGSVRRIAISMSHKTAKTEISATASQDISTAWYDVAGMATVENVSQTSLVVIPDQVSSTGNKPYCIALPLDNIRPPETPTWFDLIQELNESFSIENNLRHGAITRVWGFSSNVTIDNFAICLSLHPKDMIQYTTTSEQDCFLLVDQGSNFLPKFSLTVSSESMLSSVLRYLHSVGRNSGKNESEIRRKIAGLEGILRNSLAKECPFDNKPEALSNPEEAVRYLKTELILRRPLLGELLTRLTALKDESTRDSGDDPPARFVALQTLCSNLLRISEYGYRLSDLARLILSNYAQAQIFFAQNWPSHFRDPKSDAAMQEYIHAHPGEACQICLKGIPFEHPLWARCLSGHSFRRCAISLLVIQHPRDSKSCALCGQRYFSEEYLLRYDESSSNLHHSDSHPPRTVQMDDIYTKPTCHSHSFIEILQAACDVCITCGGKFKVP